MDEEEEESKVFDEGCTPSDQWSKDRLNILISLYFEERDLWDSTRSPTLDERQEAYERMANTLGSDVLEVSRKVRHLRTYYAKLLRDSEKKKNRHGKRWKFLDQMEFLHDHIVPRERPVSGKNKTGVQGSSKLDNGLSASPAIEMFESSSDSSTPIPHKHSIGSPMKSIKLHAAKRLKHLHHGGSSSVSVASEFSDDMDADEVFGRHVANELKLIPGMKEKQFAKLQINNILFNAQFGLVKLPEHILQSLSEVEQQSLE